MYPIPANATRIRYLESTGTQYIDTGVAPNGGTDFAIKSQLVGGSAAGNLFGCRDVNSGRPAFGLISHSSGASISVARLSSSNWNDLVSSDYRTHDYSFRNGVAYVDGVASGSYSGDTQLTNTAYVFLFNNNGSLNYPGSPPQQRVFSCQFWQDGTLVRSYVPVRVGDTGELFDRVTGTYATRVGTFVCGPDTFQQGVIPTRMMVCGVRKRPYDAREG